MIVIISAFVFHKRSNTNIPKLSGKDNVSKKLWIKDSSGKHKWLHVQTIWPSTFGFFCPSTRHIFNEKLTKRNSVQFYEGKISLKQELRSVELGVCPMQLFHFGSRDVHPVQNLVLCTKFHENQMIFTARRVCTARTMPWQDVCLSVRLSHADIESKRL